MSFIYAFYREIFISFSLWCRETKLNFHIRSQKRLDTNLFKTGLKKRERRICYRSKLKFNLIAMISHKKEQIVKQMCDQNCNSHLLQSMVLINRHANVKLLSILLNLNCIYQQITRPLSIFLIWNTEIADLSIITRI